MTETVKAQIKLAFDQIEPSEHRKNIMFASILAAYDTNNNSRTEDSKDLLADASLCAQTKIANTEPLKLRNASLFRTLLPIAACLLLVLILNVTVVPVIYARLAPQAVQSNAENFLVSSVAENNSSAGAASIATAPTTGGALTTSAEEIKNSSAEAATDSQAPTRDSAATLPDAQADAVDETAKSESDLESAQAAPTRPEITGGVRPTDASSSPSEAPEENNIAKNDVTTEVSDADNSADGGSIAEAINVGSTQINILVWLLIAAAVSLPLIAIALLWAFFSSRSNKKTTKIR
jgi:hypothetical protein